MNRLALFGLTVLTVSAFADDEVAAQQKSSMNKTEKQESQRIVLTSAAPKSEYGWYVFADALYWHADVGSTEWAWKNDNLFDPPNNVIGGDLHSLNFKWDWGFRAGIGVTMNHDTWDSNIYYTWFRTENSNTAGVGPKGAVRNIVTSAIPTTGLSVNNGFTTGNVKWKIRFNIFDWELGRWYYVSKNIGIRPHVGVKGGWISHDIDYHFTDASIPAAVVTSRGDFKNDFWGVGTSGGVNLLWVLGNAGARNDHRFSLCGDFAGAIMYGHFDIDHKEEVFDTNGNPTTGIHPTNLDRNLAVPMLQTILGFSWDTGFNRDRGHFMVKVGYEFQYWFRQYQQVRPVNNFNPATFNNAVPNNCVYHRISDDFALQGLSVDVRFDF